MAEETAWLIERAEKLNGTSPDAWYLCAGQRGFFWQAHWSGAVRFARKQDADQFVEGIRGTMDNVIYNRTVRGLRPEDPPPSVCEHAWSDPFTAARR